MTPACVSMKPQSKWHLNMASTSLIPEGACSCSCPRKRESAPLASATRIKFRRSKMKLPDCQCAEELALRYRFPIVQKHLQADICHGVFIEGLHDIERHRGHVGPGQQRFQNLLPRTYAGRENLCLVSIAIVDIANLLDQQHAVIACEFFAMNKRADVRCSCLRGQISLHRGEAQRHVRFNAFT